MSEQFPQSLQQAGTRAVPAALLFLLALVWLPVGSPAHTRQARPPWSAILGVKIGMSLDEACARLDGLGTREGQLTRAGGRKEVWTLQKTEYQYLVVKTNANGRIIQISGFFRPAQGLPFEQLGQLAHAVGVTSSQSIWNVATTEGAYRLVAKGAGGKASVVYLLDLSLPALQ
jgi:hypothetical protein